MLGLSSPAPIGIGSIGDATPSYMFVLHLPPHWGGAVCRRFDAPTPSAVDATLEAGDEVRRHSYAIDATPQRTRGHK